MSYNWVHCVLAFISEVVGGARDTPSTRPTFGQLLRGRGCNLGVVTMSLASDHFDFVSAPERICAKCAQKKRTLCSW